MFVILGLYQVQSEIQHPVEQNLAVKGEDNRVVTLNTGRVVYMPAARVKARYFIKISYRSLSGVWVRRNLHLPSSRYRTAFIFRKTANEPFPVWKVKPQEIGTQDCRRRRRRRREMRDKVGEVSFRVVGINYTPLLSEISRNIHGMPSKGCVI